MTEQEILDLEFWKDGYPTSLKSDKHGGFYLQCGFVKIHFHNIFGDKSFYEAHVEIDFDEHYNQNRLNFISSDIERSHEWIKNVLDLINPKDHYLNR